jgi:prepilin peptidase CpaA
LNLAAAAPFWLVIALCCALVAAAIEDAARLRISNVTSLAVLAGAVVAALIEGPSPAIWQNFAVFAVILVLGTVAFAAGLLGGGDVKLFAVAGLWFELRPALGFVAIVFISGGVVAILYLLSRPFRRRISGSRKSARVPYGIAIAVGSLAMVLVQRGAFTRQERPLPPVTILPHRT